MLTTQVASSFIRLLLASMRWCTFSSSQAYWIKHIYELWQSIYFLIHWLMHNIWLYVHSGFNWLYNKIETCTSLILGFIMCFPFREIAYYNRGVGKICGKRHLLELSFNSTWVLVGNWMFCLQNLPCLVSLWLMCAGCGEFCTKIGTFRNFCKDIRNFFFSEAT